MGKKDFSSATAEERREATESAEPMPPVIELKPGQASGTDADRMREKVFRATAAPSARRRPVLADEALHGPVGDFVHALEPHTEADPVGVLVQVLVGLGNALGRGPVFRVGATEHRLNLFAVLVGQTSIGRKGTAWDEAQRLVEAVDPTWVWQSGLSTGEGLIRHVRDAAMGRDEKTGAEVVVDAGVTDKRLLVIETELAGTLAVLARDTNTLSAKLRDAYDGKRLQTMTKNSPLVATGAHISLIGHITPGELRRTISETEMVNGLCNRILWTFVESEKDLPSPAQMPAGSFDSYVSLLRTRVDGGRAAGEVRWSDDAQRLWKSIYGPLKRPPHREGLLGAITARGVSQVIRLTCLYAVLDGTRVARVEHMKAALAVWKYCEASAVHVFGDSTGNKDADRLHRGLVAAGANGLTQTEVQVEVFGRNLKADRLHAAGELLVELGMAVCEVEGTGKKRTTRWWAACHRRQSPGAAS